MQAKRAVFGQFAQILCYPEKAVLQHAARLRLALEQQPDICKKLTPFWEFIRQRELKEVEELFTSTFDLNPTCCLEIGWHLYGEDYRRGEFLVQMRDALREDNLPESAELQDHLSHCLHLLSVLDETDARAFSHRFLLPAIGKIVRGLPPENPYAGVVVALQELLIEHFGAAENTGAANHRPSGRNLPVLG